MAGRRPDANLPAYDGVHILVSPHFKFTAILTLSILLGGVLCTFPKNTTLQKCFVLKNEDSERLNPD